MARYTAALLLGSGQAIAVKNIRIQEVKTLLVAYVTWHKGRVPRQNCENFRLKSPIRNFRSRTVKPKTYLRAKTLYFVSTNGSQREKSEIRHQA